MAKTLAIDLDGTLFYPREKVKMIPQENIDFIRDFIDNGNKVVLCTGRNLPYALMVQEKLERQVDVIGCNSAYIYINGEVKKMSTFEPSVIEEMVQVFKEKFDIHAWLLMSKDQSLVITGKMGFFKKTFYKAFYASQGIYAEKYVISDKVFEEELEHGKIFKLMMFFGLGQKNKNRACEANKYLREHYGDKIEASWTDNFIELTPAEVNKSNGLKLYCEMTNTNANDVYVVGDSGNDISMFQTYKEHSFCMNHSPEKIKKFAKYHVDMVADIKNYLGE